MRRFFVLCLVLCILASIISGCGQKAESSNKAAEKVEKSADDNLKSNEKTSPVSHDADFIIHVEDTKDGSYSIPSSGENLDFQLTLSLFAWKDEGETVFGKYTGAAFLTFSFDESKLTDADLTYAGNFVFNSYCSNMEFEIAPYDSDKFNAARITGPDGSAGLAPLVIPDGMSVFFSDWNFSSTDNQIVLDSDTNQQLYNGSGASSGYGGTSPVSINLLVSGNDVTVEIPTYNSTYSLDFFRGTATVEPDGEGAAAEELFLALIDQMEEEASNVSVQDSAPLQDSQAVLQPDGTIEFENENGGKVTFTSDCMKMDSDGDGIIDTFVNEDGVYVDTDGDGVIDQFYESEFSDDGVYE